MLLGELQSQAGVGARPLSADTRGLSTGRPGRQLAESYRRWQWARRTMSVQSGPGQADCATRLKSCDSDSCFWLCCCQLSLHGPVPAWVTQVDSFSVVEEGGGL